MDEAEKVFLRRRVPAEAGDGAVVSAARLSAEELASEKNQVMDELLARPDIPSDYGAEMVALYRDRSQDVYTRDFAVQHIGLYLETLSRRGEYDPASRESARLKAALEDAADETRTIVAAAAFRALDDLSAFDPSFDRRRFDDRLVACVGDVSAAPAARVMALQICGERGLVRALAGINRVLGERDASAPVRDAAEYARRSIQAGEGTR